MHNRTCALVKVIRQHNKEWIGAKQKTLGAKEYTKKYYGTSTKNSRDICIGKMGFWWKEKEKKHDLKELKTDK